MEGWVNMFFSLPMGILSILSLQWDYNGITNYRRTFVNGVFMKDKIVSMGERKAFSPIPQNW